MGLARAQGNGPRLPYPSGPGYNAPQQSSFGQQQQPPVPYGSRPDFAPAPQAAQYGQQPSYGGYQGGYGQAPFAISPSPYPPQPSQGYGAQGHPPPGGYQASYPGASPYGGQPPQAQYGAPPGQQQYGQQGGQQPGYGQQQQQYGQAPQAGGDVGSYRQLLQQAVQQKNLETFFPPGSPAIDQVAQLAVRNIPQLCQAWHLPQEIGRDVARLGLYDIVLFVDDSGSMQFEEHGERIQDLKVVIERVAFAATLFDPDGISIRFMNTNLPNGVGDGVRDAAQVSQILSNVQYKGLTPMGRELRKKVIDGLVLPAARSGQLKKPVLVIAITDGQPAGDDSPDAVFDTIRYAVNEVGRASRSTGGIAFQFAQVGNDAKAKEFLGRLDSDPTVGNHVDVTSNYEQEQEEMARQQPPVDLTPDLWCVKLLLGSIDPTYDSKDEVRSYRPSAPGGQPQRPPQQGGYPPQQGYGAPPGQYGAPPPGQYGGNQYGQPQYGQQGPPGGQYGQQQGGYGQQQGGYGAPPPPRY